MPIKSLPQDWLYCETWCAKEDLKTAKSIDLCNNPLTKVTLRLHFFFIMYYNLSQEPKLSAARRIVAEWTDYDEEMNRLREQIAKDKINDISEGLNAEEDIAADAKNDRIEL